MGKTKSDAGFEFDRGAPPPKERPKTRFTTATPARRRIVVDWHYRVQDLRIAMSNAIDGLQRDYPKAYGAAEAELDRKTYLEPIEAQEKYFADACKDVVEDEPIAQWLVNTVKGMGWSFTAQLIGLIGDIKMFDTISKLWAYCGLTPDSRRVEGERLHHSPALKRLLYNIATGFLKARGYYAGVYAHFKTQEEDKAERFMRWLRGQLQLRAAANDEQAAALLERIRQEEQKFMAARAAQPPKVFSNAKYLAAIYEASRLLGFAPPRQDARSYAVFVLSIKYLTDKGGFPGDPALTPAHRHSRAFRKVEKIFLQHLWLKWRTLEGATISAPWVFGPGGHDPHHYIQPPEGKDAVFPISGTMLDSQAEVA